MRTLIFALTLASFTFGQRFEIVGRGCCRGDLPPTLTASPREGHIVFSGGGAPISAPGGLFVSGPAAASSLGNGGFSFLDPSTALGLAYFATSSAGDWTVASPLPPSLESAVLHLQAVFLDRRMSIGVALSDAGRLTR